MIIDSLWVLLLGMVGIFVVMGVIYTCTVVINRISTKDKAVKSEKDN